MRGSTVQTQQGGDISILGPGGRLLVGSSTASPAIDPASEGILTLEHGNIATFTDSDVLAAQSRVMTEQGGSILMWSPNGNLDIAALQVVNVFNIQVQGEAFGLPPRPSTNLALATADAAAKEAVKVLQDLNDQQRRQTLDSIVTVEVTGFGGEGDEPTICVPSSANAYAAPRQQFHIQRVRTCP